MTKKLLPYPGRDQGEGSGAVGSEAEEGVDAARRRPTTTREAAVPGHSAPDRSKAAASHAISRRGLRTATAIGAVTLGLTALTACEKPTPLATVTVGTTTVTTEADCYEDGKALKEAEAKECTDEEPEKSINLGEGDTLRVGVEPDMAETGWMVFSDREALVPESTKKTYHSFPGDALFQQQDPNTGQPTAPKKSAKISIILTEDGEFKGVWSVTVKRDR
ncbi:DUF2771 domain-containing protein [Streptomyces sp. N2-109]|uniref:DUF2771 domain-containing protein n=1 Tax=Streptomyces gossypii TaxID=2883101 RepID=A0ABT2JXV7_9ACTN|nr:DUF2771 domain-containing protein [Streptomyces gossypii]MCT2592733.1 DUF2771 domain-containing protein [Streptomyces gossypii]